MTGKTTRYTRSSAIDEGHLYASCQLTSCQLPRNSAETTCTTIPEQIEVMKLEGYSGTMSNKHVHSTIMRSSRFHCPIGVINKPTTDELWMQYNTMQYKICKAPCCRGFRGAIGDFCIPVYRRLTVAKFSKSTM